MTHPTDEYRAEIANLRDALAGPPEAVVPPFSDVRRRVHRIRARRRTATRAALASAACLVVFAVAVVIPRGEQQAPVDQAVAEAELRALQDRLDQLEGEMAGLRAQLAARESAPVPAVSSATQHEMAAAVVMEAGLHMEQDLGSTAVALSRYHDVLTYFPKTEAAERAQARIEALGAPTI